jgi:hypothetical protein
MDQNENTDQKKKDFAVTYAIENTMRGGGSAPRMTVEMPDRVLSLPAAVFAVMHSAYAVCEMENPLQGAASPHEITFGVVCHDDEVRTAALLNKEYNNRAENRGGATTPAMVAALLDQLDGVCSPPGGPHNVFYWVGQRIQECYGQEDARAAVRAVRLESARIERERGEDCEPIIHPIRQPARRMRMR